MYLDGVAGTAADAAGINSVVVLALVLVGEACDESPVPGGIEADGPGPVAGLDRNGVDFELDTGIFEVTDICVQIVGEVGSGSYWSVVEEVLGEALVEVDATEDPVAEEAVVDTCVPGDGGLPLEVGVVTLCRDRLDKSCAERIHTGVGVIYVGSEGRVVTAAEILLAGLTVRKAYLQCGNGI